MQSQGIPERDIETQTLNYVMIRFDYGEWYALYGSAVITVHPGNNSHVVFQKVLRSPKLETCVCSALLLIY